MAQQALSTAVLTPRTAVSLEGIGDVVDAGRPSGYAHLGGRHLPTVGRLVSAARSAAAALDRPALRPSRRGRWQSVPRSVRRYAAGRLRVSAVALEPNSFVPGPSSRASRARGMEVLFLVSGRAHLIASGPDGQMRSAAELGPGRARVLGSAGGDSHHLVNTGDEVAVVVRVSA
ncbi:hypothetical protein [Nocardiopsis algeriensis]|uniref:Cupin domain-containing protein n=1 Tax=Nocardiopsis algeriensis TaxID=1478215 RepID=A0A841IQD3_9ACTN|nr:hypothetical protein [Nocardiopsis algeriensis]MBB6120873.1 hypothetical protein [Nocardiopsis algeriensis]